MIPQGWVCRGDAFGKRLEHVCEAHPVPLLTVVSVFYFFVAAPVASWKVLENDELFTLTIANLPSFDDVWEALLTGGEQLPPLFYVLTRASLWLHDGPLGLRLPAILGFGVLGLCLFRFVAKRSTVLLGLTAMLIPMATGAGSFAFEARPYGLVLGFAGIALVCWQSIREPGRRGIALFGFFSSLAAAVACHYYAVLLLVPFACGEAVRSFSTRAIDVSAATALAASLSPLLLFLPLLASANAYSSAFWAQPSWLDGLRFYRFISMSAGLPMLGILVLAALSTYFAPGVGRGTDPRRFPSLRPDEIAVALGFLAMPFVAATMAMFVTHAFTHRYALPAVLGIGVLLPFGFHSALRGRKELLLLASLFLVLAFGIRAGMTLQEAEFNAARMAATISMLEAEPRKDLPIVCSDPHVFLLLSHYAPQEIRSRLVYLSSAEVSKRRLGHDSIERGMVDLLGTSFRLNVQVYERFLASNEPFLLCGAPGHFLNWLLPELAASPASIELRSQSASGRASPLATVLSRNEVLVFLVSPRPA